MNDINDYIKECYRTAKGHGFWDDDIDKKDMLKICKPALIYVANMVEKIRGGNEILEPKMYQDVVAYDWIDQKLLLITTEIGECLCTETAEETMEELADIFIRLMDLIGFVEENLGLDFIETVDAKMKINEGRPYLHNKKC